MSCLIHSPVVQSQSCLHLERSNAYCWRYLVRQALHICVSIAQTNYRLVHHPTETSAVLIPDITTLVPRVLSLLEIGRGEHAAGQATLFTRNLVCHSFGILVEGSLRDQNIWNTVKAQVNFDSLVSSLLLCENDRPVRRDIVERLKMLAGTVKSKQMPASPSSEELSTNESPLRIDMLATIWSAFVNNIPQTCGVANQSEEFFTASLFIFSSVAERSPRDVVLSEYMKEWTAVLLEHETKEVIIPQPVCEVSLCC